MQEGSLPARVGYNRCRMMAADVIETPQHIIITAHYNNRLTSNSGSHELAWHFHLVESPDQLPILAEHSLGLEFGNAGIYVPGRWYSRGFLQDCLIVITGDNFLY